MPTHSHTYTLLLSPFYKFPNELTKYSSQFLIKSLSRCLDYYKHVTIFITKIDIMLWLFFLSYIYVISFIHLIFSVSITFEVLIKIGNHFSVHSNTAENLVIFFLFLKIPLLGLMPFHLNLDWLFSNLL